MQKISLGQLVEMNRSLTKIGFTNRAPSMFGEIDRGGEEELQKTRHNGTSNSQDNYLRIMLHLAPREVGNETIGSQSARHFVMNVNKHNCFILSASVDLNDIYVLIKL